MLVFIDRGRRADRFLEWKVRIFTLAAALVLAGMFLEVTWMTGVAIVLLASAMLLRFLPGGPPVEGDEEDDESDVPFPVAPDLAGPDDVDREEGAR